MCLSLCLGLYVCVRGVVVVLHHAAPPPRGAGIRVLGNDDADLVTPDIASATYHYHSSHCTIQHLTEQGYLSLSSLRYISSKHFLFQSIHFLK